MPRLSLRDRSLAVQFAVIAALAGLLVVLGDSMVGAFLRTGESLRTALIEGTLSLVLLIPSGYLLARLYRSIAPPLERLSDSIRRYQDGDLTARVAPSTASTSEVGYLERSFNSMAERIERMVGDLRELDRLKTDFLSTVSHELKTPLTAISGYVRILLAGDAGSLTAEQREFLGIVDSNALRLTSLINDLLDVSRLEGGRVTIERTPLDLRELLRDCEKTLRVLAEAKGLALHVRIPNDPVRVSGDRDRIVQALLNIGSNAVKYTERGSVTIDAETSGDNAVITVSDTGIGMTQAEMSRLFEKFYRIPSKLSEREHGTGLGLVIARGWIEAHGGALTLDSVHGEGSQFRLTLPLLHSEPSTEVEPATGKILLVQSDSDLRGILARALERKGYIVDQLDRGGVAVERLRTGGYSAAIVDSRLKDLPGRAVLDAWTRTGDSAMVPMLLIGEGTDYHMDGGLDRLVSTLVKRFARRGEADGSHPHR